MNIYSILKLASGSRVPGFVKILGLWAMHVTGRRYTGVFLDPVLACNLRCRMCFFSDDAKRATMHGIMDDAAFDSVAKALFPRALKLQIGCGAEPTLFNGLRRLVKRGADAGIPYISLITNGQLIADGKVNLMELAEAGLSEITLSMHGTQPDTYEYLMPGASYERLLKLTGIIGDVKRACPGFKVRVNFTVNSMNVTDLAGNDFWRVWPEGVLPDIVQLRPVQKLGESKWDDFDLSPLIEKYDSTIGNVVSQCREWGITCIAPTREQIDEVATPQSGVSALVEDLTYCYVSPTGCYKPDFDPATDNFDSYHRRKHTAWKLLKAAFTGNFSDRNRKVSKKLNYTVK